MHPTFLLPYLAAACVSCSPPLAPVITAPADVASPGTPASGVAPVAPARLGQRQVPPQAAPMVTILQAARAADAHLFQSAYSEGIRGDTGQADWEKNVREAQTNLTKLFGDCRLDDFTFSFDGDASTGRLITRCGGGASVSLKVVREGSEWKLDER